ncbi:uracil-DNA glycosylase [Lentzea kentuckyensis]|uniref:uracil-DNA glycosylase n=1 Tax=Lentzea kentuckyensis TaxID=360086 RepID=UPI000A3CB133|nr:uracil-DNA glycosylase [Lentzea kentuckyensis]
MRQAHTDPSIIAAKHARLHEQHVAPLVDLADRIAAAEELPPGTVPYPDPEFGGIRARALFLLDSPGPRAKLETGGSGLLSIDNDDPSAARAHAAYRTFRIDRDQCLHWNVCPFPTAKDQSSPSERTRAARYTRELLDLLSALEVVTLLGRAAEDGWRRTGICRSDLVVLHGPHPSNRGINSVAGNAERFQSTMRTVALHLAQPARPADNRPASTL